MSSSVEPEKVGLSRNDPECVAKTTQLETKTSTTVYHTAKPDLAHILAENVTLTPLPANPETEEKLAKVKKLFADLKSYSENKSTADLARAEDLLMNFLKNYFATSKQTSHMANGYKMTMEICNQLEGWLTAFRTFDTDRKKHPGYICNGYKSALVGLIRFEFRSFGSDYGCAYILEKMMASYNERARYAPLEGARNEYIESALHDAIAFLCDRLVYYMMWWFVHEPNPRGYIR